LSRLLLLFFFSSRRRHTRSKRDWSSDVCSSDLASGDRLLISLLVHAKEKKSFFGLGAEATVHIWGRPRLDQAAQTLRLADVELEIGRASCRGRVWSWGVGGSLKLGGGRGAWGGE